MWCVWCVVLTLPFVCCGCGWGVRGWWCVGGSVSRRCVCPPSWLTSRRGVCGRLDVWSGLRVVGGVMLGVAACLCVPGCLVWTVLCVWITW